MQKQGQVSSKEYYKVKVLILFGYNGKPFQGSQMQKETEQTVEFSLERGLGMAGLVKESNRGDLSKIGWSRASRTDKGVHALSNSVACKLEVDKKFVRDYDEALGKEGNKFRIDWQKVIHQINGNLESYLRVMDISVVTNGFNVKKFASDRVYHYLCPLEMFYPGEASRLEEPEVRAQVVATLDSLMQRYKGTHNFHNFTTKVTFQDPQARRHMMSFRTEEYSHPETPEGQLGHWVLIELQGQSFMYHQIRKMVGLVSRVMVEGLQEETVEEAFGEEKKNLWLAPAEGLYLKTINFFGYNQKRDVHIRLEKSEGAEEAMERFKKEVIYPQIVKSEWENRRFSEWMHMTKRNEYEEDQVEQLG